MSIGDIKTVLDAEQVAAAVALHLTKIVGEAIRDLGSVPSGHLYAAVMDHLDIHKYNLIIDKLIEAKLVRRDRSHLLTWIGSTS